MVAGLNYKLTIALMKEDSNICLGAIKVTIYDHFGELQVTKWGDKLSCNEEVHELLDEVRQQTEVEEEEQQEEQEEKALEVEGEIEDGMEEVEPNE